MKIIIEPCLLFKNVQHVKSGYGVTGLFGFFFKSPDDLKQEILGRLAERINQCLTVTDVRNLRTEFFSGEIKMESSDVRYLSKSGTGTFTRSEP